MKTLIRCIEALLFAGLIGFLIFGGLSTADAQPRRAYSDVHYSRAVKKLPKGYKKVRFKGERLYFHRGNFYGKARRGFVVVDPPFGAVIRKLPRNYTVVRIGRQKYFRHNGIFYVKVRKGFEVVPPPWATDVYFGGWGIPSLAFGFGLSYRYSPVHKTYRVAFNRRMHGKMNRQFKRQMQKNRRQNWTAKNRTPNRMGPRGETRAESRRQRRGMND